jgi:hypothetical protein
VIWYLFGLFSEVRSHKGSCLQIKTTAGGR